MTPKERFEQAEKVIEKFNKEVSDYIDSHALSELPPFEKLQRKEQIGTIYRDDQKYYETITDYKSKYFGMSAFFLKLKSEINDRVLSRKIDEAISYVDKKAETLTTMGFRAQSRIKFYQNVIYLVANMSYGDY